MDNETIQLWFRYEEVAMHFNNLLMQYRLQLLGGVGALSTVAGYLIGEKVEKLHLQLKLQFMFSCGMFVLIAAAASLDLFYYDKLLRGAVDAILDLEKQNPKLTLSTEIEAWASSGKDTIKHVYTSILVLVGLFTIYSGVRYAWSDKSAEAPGSTAPCTCKCSCNSAPATKRSKDA